MFRFKLLLCAWLFSGAWVEGPLLPEQLLQEGDVIFIGDTGSWADLAARFSQSDQRYGHVGVIVRDGDDWAVIDAGGDPSSKMARVDLRPLAMFLGRAKAVGLYRPQLGDVRRSAFVHAVVNYGKAQLPFDPEFSLDTEDNAYCTELVWRALSESLGEDAVPKKTRWWELEIISLEDLQKSPHLQPVAERVR